MPFGLRPIHLVVIVIVGLVIFGPKRLPQIGRWLGRMFLELRRGAQDMADGFKEESAKAPEQEPQSQAVKAGSPATQEGGPSTATGAPTEARPSPTPYPETGLFCTQCGTRNPLDSRFCGECGTKLVT